MIAYTLNQPTHRAAEVIPAEEEEEGEIELS